MQEILLQNWFMDNIPDPNMLWKKAMESQVLFVRDKLKHAFKFDGSNEARALRENTTVVSTHTSKSIKLPVYSIIWRDIRLIMRENFYDWKVSVESGHELIGLDSIGLFVPMRGINPIYCEGFKKEWVYPSYHESKRRFTIELNSDFDLYCLVKLIAFNNGH